jgi:tetratricopeptide (TPR) repeat protein
VRSLVVADTGDAGLRYKLLETTRAYAREKLIEAEEIDTVECRHGRYFHRLFECAPDHWLRMPDADWRAIYPLELDNVRAALDWAHGASGDPAIAVGLASASGPMWAKLSLHCEGLQRLETAVAKLQMHISESDQARLWFWIGMLSVAAPAKAAVALEQAVDVYRRLGDTLGLGVSLARLGCELAVMGRSDESAPVLAEAFPLLERTGLPKALAQYFDYFGILKMLTGDLASARLQFEKALSLSRRAGAEREVLRIVGNIAELAWVLGDLDSAIAGFRETVALVREMPLITKSTLGFNLLNLAGVLTERGELDEALGAAREGLPLLSDGGYAWIFMDHLALRAGLAGKLANAARTAGYTDSAFAAKESSRQPNETRAHDRLQVLLREKLAPGELERLLAEGAKISEEEACRLVLEE